MAQTSYATAPAIGLAGQIADTSDVNALSLINGEASANLPFGIMVAAGATDTECLLPAAAGDQLLGVTVRDHSRSAASLSTTGAIAPDNMCSVMKEGTIYVLPEQTVVKSDPVYCRYTAGAGDLTVGRFRKDAGGTAQVTTVTPTAVNSTVYNMTVKGRAYAYTSDGSATAAEIVTAFTALINAETAFHGVTASGTTTLILTGTLASAFLTSLGANLAGVDSTPYVAKAVLIPSTNARWGAGGAADAATPLILDLV